MKTRPTILFVFRKAKRDAGLEITSGSDGRIVCRITVRGKHSFISLGLSTTYGEWDSYAQRVASRTTASKQLNEQITKLRDELNDLAADLHRQGKPVTARRLQQLYLSNGAVLSMLELYEAFSAERQGLIGVEIAKASATVTRVYYNKLSAFLQAHRMPDLRPEEFTHNLADKFIYWLLKEQNFKRSTANKHVQHIHQVLRWGIRREHLDKNPMEFYKYKHVAAGEIKHLTVGELSILAAKELPPYLDRVRDCFVFQCWTGLAYADLAGLNVRRDAEYHQDGQGRLRRVLHITRQKSTLHHGYECVIPLLPEAERLLAKHSDELPVPTNQIYNRYLKEVGQVCELPAEKMTTHVGRKTAGVMMLNLGIRMEVVSKFLGHSSVRMTEKVYAKILDKTLVNEFDRVFGGEVAVAVPAALEIGPVPVIAPPTQAQQRLIARAKRDAALLLPAKPETGEKLWRRPPPVTSWDLQRGGVAA